MIRFFFKCVKIIFLAIAVTFVLFCVLFAVLQSKWAKVQIREKVVSYLKDAGIHANVSDLEGQMPFTWSIKEIDLELDKDNQLKLSNVKFRFAIFPLLRGHLAINYLKIENADYSFCFSKGQEEPAGKMATAQEFSAKIHEGKAAFRHSLETLSLPFPIKLNHFSIDRLNLMDCKDAFTTTVGVAGNAMARKDKSAFSLEFRLFLPDTNQTTFEAVLSGNKKKDFITAKLDMNIHLNPSFFFEGISGDTAIGINLNGPWISWKEILYDLPLTNTPITGSVKGMITKTHVNHLPILSRNWKFKTELSLTSGQEVHLQKVLLLSDLVHIKGWAQLQSSWEKSIATLAFSTPDLSLFPYPISGSAKGVTTFQRGNFNASFETGDLKLDGYKANTLSALIEGSVKNNEWEADVKLQSDDAQIPFKTSFTFDFVPKIEFSIVDFDLKTAVATASANLHYDLSDHFYEGTLIADVESLTPFGKLFNEETLNGRLIGEIALSNDNNSQSAKCSLIGNNLCYREILLDDLSVSADLKNLFTDMTGNFNFLAEKVFTSGLYLNRLNFNTHSDDIQWPFYLSAEGRIESPFHCFAKGFWQKDLSLFTLELTDLIGELAQTPFSLKYPFEIEWGADYLNLSPFDFTIGSGNLFSTFELGPVRSFGKWELNHFPLEILSCFRPRFALNGYVSGAGFIDASEEHIEGVLNAAIEEAGILHFGKKEPFRAKGSLQARINDKMMQVHAALSATDRQFLDFNGSLPILYNLYPFKISLDKTKKTSAELLAEGKLQDLFDFVNMGTSSITGLFSCRLFLSQTLSSPSLLGQIELQNGTYENYFTGIDLRNINAQFEAQNEEIRLLELSANDDKSGEVYATGKILLEPDKKFPYAFEAEMQGLHAVGFDMIDCDLTGPLYLTGDLQNLGVQGNFLVDAAKIQIGERLPYEIPSMEVSYINVPKMVPPRKVSNEPIFKSHIDLELTSEGTVRVQGRGLNADLEGNVHLYGTNTNILANGSLQLVKGEYTFSGKVFKLTDGEVIFSDKPSPAAYLHLNGTLSLPDLTITAMLRGPLVSPQLTFQSNPHKSTSSILALILFNKEISEISHPEAIQLASTLVSLSGGAGPDVLDTIRKSIGIDRLNIGSKPGSDEVSVQIGKYLTRGIMITLAQSTTSSQVIVEVELPKGFIFQAETQEEGEGKFSLKWRRSY